MTRRIVLMLSHAIEEWQQLDLLTSLGYEVFSIGGYIDPRSPHSPLRPPLDIPFYPDLKQAVDDLGTADNLTAAQSRIPDALLDWLGDDGAIILHHKEERLWGDWPRLLDWKRGNGGRRIIWRTVGQSVSTNERNALPYRMAGCERVAYSPREANIPGYTGHDALIRFWGVQSDREWTGDDARVINIAQHLRQRDPFTNWRFWDSATRDLPRLAIGPGSEVIGGTGPVSPEEMADALHTARAFLFCGSQPASYTLALIEALHAGIPVVSIGPSWMRVPYDGHDASELFEGHELAPLSADDPNDAFHLLRRLLADKDWAKVVSAQSRAIARDVFDRDRVGAEWKAYLG